MTEMPDCLAHYTTAAGQAFSLDPIEGLQSFNAIVRQCTDEKLTNFEYVDRFAAWVQERTGVALGKAEANWLIRDLDRRALEGKDGAGPTPS